MVKRIDFKRSGKRYDILSKCQIADQEQEATGDEFVLTSKFMEHTEYQAPEDMEFDGETIQKGTELRLVTGVVLEPETVDAQGDIYNADEIRKSAHKFMADYSGQGNGVQHKSFGNKKLKIVESFISPVDFKIGKADVKKGSWVMTTLVLDDAIWKGIKEGSITGYSIRGRSKANYEEA